MNYSYCDILPNRQFLTVRRNIPLLNRKIINTAVIDCIFTSERRTSLKVKYQIQKNPVSKKEPTSNILNKKLKIRLTKKTNIQILTKRTDPINRKKPTQILTKN